MKIWGRFRNPKLARTATLAFLVFLVLAIVAYASTFWSFNQDLTVPTGSLALYRDAEGTNLIGNGSNQSLTGLWIWNGGGWNATVFVKNDGSSIINFTISISGYKAGWIAGYSVPLGQSGLFVGEIRPINLWIYGSPPPVSGDSTSSFTVIVSVA